MQRSPPWHGWVQTPDLMFFQTSTNLLFNQIETLLTSMADEDYRMPVPHLNGSSVGQHMRHLLEFYGCLLLACGSGTVNYEKRPRDLRLEQETAAALAYLHRLESSFTCLMANIDLKLEVTYGRSTPVTSEVPTSLLREIVYLSEHTVHHLAIIAVALRCALQHVPMPEHLGVAESTLRARDVAQIVAGPTHSEAGHASERIAPAIIVQS